MIDNGLFTRFPKPDVILGQHVIRVPRAPSAGAQRCHYVGRRTACRSGCSAGAPTARCLRPASIPW